jgi:hypothetical protein
MNGPGLVRPGPLPFRANARYDNLTSQMASPYGVISLLLDHQIQRPGDGNWQFLWSKAGNNASNEATSLDPAANK